MIKNALHKRGKAAFCEFAIILTKVNTCLWSG